MRPLALACWIALAGACRDATAPAGTGEPAPAADSGPAPPLRKDGTVYAESELMGTRVSINVYVGAGGDTRSAGRAIEEAFAEMDRLEGLLSEWRETSEVSALNRAAGGAALVVGPELFEVLRRGLEISEATDGAFDMTFHGIGSLWSFKPGARPPAPAAITERLPLVNWRNLLLDSNAHTAKLALPGMKVGLGAIAKGYAVDRASALLKRRGHRDHIVEAGGDMYCAGSKAGQPWTVGVQDPDRRGTAGAIPVREEAVVTSGNYERYFEHEGKRYAHILDPRTGWPLLESESPKSVTLLARDATTADAFCTAVMVMGADAGLAFVERRSDLQVVILTHDGRTLVSSGLRGRFVGDVPPATTSSH